MSSNRKTCRNKSNFTSQVFIIYSLEKRGCCKTSCLVSALMEKSNKKCLEGVISGNPALQSGDEAGMIMNPVRRTELRELPPSRPVASSRRGPSSRRMDFRGLPPLKDGVTANVALQAGRSFATAPFCYQETSSVPFYTSLAGDAAYGDKCLACVPPSPNNETPCHGFRQPSGTTFTPSGRV